MRAVVHSGPTRRLRARDPQLACCSASRDSQQSWADAMLESLAARQPVAPAQELYNPDFAPVEEGSRTFSVFDIAALWIGLVVCVPTYTLVGSLLDLGFSAVQGLGIILVRSAVVFTCACRTT